MFKISFRGRSGRIIENCIPAVVSVSLHIIGEYVYVTELQ